MALVNRVEFFPQAYDFMMLGYSMHVVANQDRQRMRIKSVELEPIKECDPFPEPTFYFDRESAQALMDRLWSCGIRPTEGAGSAGAMAATQLHLNDMRELTQRLLKQIIYEE